MSNDDKKLKLDDQTAAVFAKKGYIAEKLLNNGAFGWVYKGRNEKTGLTVAIKAMNLEKIGQTMEKKFFPRELHALKGIVHEHVVTVYDIIQSNGVIYILMEFAENGDINDYLKKNGPLPENLAGFWFAQMCSALKHVHFEMMIAHRDIKTDNILLTDNLKVTKLADFGFAATTALDEHGNTVMSKTYCGTKPYESYQIIRKVPYDPFAADCWAMGVTLYYMLLCRYPFTGWSKSAEVMLKEMETEAYKQRFSKRALSPEVQELLGMFFELKERDRINMKYVHIHEWVKKKGKGFEVVKKNN